jgi:hypothetical protein
MDKDMQYGHVMQHEPGHAAWPWACIIDIGDTDMYYDLIGAFGSSYAKDRNYRYIDIIITRNF